jgi:hypothetical protein
MIEWVRITPLTLPLQHTHVLTVNANLKNATIYHNVHIKYGDFMLRSTEMCDRHTQHVPTHWALMNFPEKESVDDTRTLEQTVKQDGSL